MTGAGREALLALVAVLAVTAVVVAVVVLRPRSEDGAVAGDDRTPEVAPVTVYAAGDIARCGDEGDEATAKIIEEDPTATVLALGDLAYNSGSAEDFAECYDPSWGPFRSRTRPVPGNHEYRTDDARPYFDYFGAAAGTQGEGWYSFDLGGWHIVALNSNCDDIGGCDEGSEQHEWLASDLEANASRCTLAFWHAPRFSSGRHAGTRSVEDLWQLLLDHDVEFLLAGHEHFYERSAPLDADGEVDEENGVRQFIVGTGGGNFYEFRERMPGSEAAIADTYGLLRLILREDGYDWEFVPTTADGASDAGSDECR